MSKILEPHWNEYLTKVMSKSAGVTQVVETKRAFYAGACALFHAVNTMLNPGAEPTDADLLKMEELHRELEKFNEDVKAGRA